jgi:PAS domain S-box-containing protein
MIRTHASGVRRHTENLRDAVIVADLHTDRIALWNSAAAALFGYALDEARALPIPALVPERLRARYRSGLARYRETGHSPYLDTPEALELPALRKDGAEVQVALTLSPLHGSDGGRRFVVAIVRDATGRQRTGAASIDRRADEHDQVRRLADLAARQADFAAMIAHELSSPSAAIRNYATLLARGGLSPQERARLLTALQAETALLNALVADVQALAEAERGEFTVHPRPIAIGVLLADAATFAATLPGDHPCSAAPPPDGQVWADPERIGQVLRNLLSNAAKYSPPGAPIAVRAIREGARVRFEVAEAGPGIPPADRERIFHKFARLTSGTPARGSGLGLYLSRQIVRAHGGELTVESTPGAGAVFRFALDVVR